MANNRRKKSNSRKPEPAKAQKAVVNEVKEMDEIDAVEEEDIVEDEVPAMSSAERDKQRKENRQNALLLIGAIAILAIVGLVIWITSGSGDEEQTAAVATTTAVAAADQEAVTEEDKKEADAAEDVEGAEAVEGTEAVEGAEAAEGTEAVEGTETAEGTEAAPAGQDEIQSTTVMNKGETYPITQDMKMYAEPSTASEVVMDISGSAGWAVAIEEPAEQGNGWHRVSIWLQELPEYPTYGYIQIP